VPIDILAEVLFAVRFKLSPLLKRGCGVNLFALIAYPEAELCETGAGVSRVSTDTLRLRTEMVERAHNTT
jgi:hypothetical protein